MVARLLEELFKRSVGTAFLASHGGQEETPYKTRSAWSSSTKAPEKWGAPGGVEASPSVATAPGVRAGKPQGLGLAGDEGVIRSAHPCPATTSAPDLFLPVSYLDHFLFF